MKGARGTKMSTQTTMEDSRKDRTPKLAYRGSELYERLVEHARNGGEEYERMHSTPDERMEMLASRIVRLEEDAVSQNALYEVAIWTLLTKGPREFSDQRCDRLLASAAMRGHDSAQFVTAKACLDGVEWAVEEMRRASSEGNPFELARAWLARLSDDGYVDAQMEMGSDLWESGNPAKGYAVFSSITHNYADALVRLGIHQLPDNPEAAFANLDKGESRNGNRGILCELERLLSRT